LVIRPLVIVFVTLQIRSALAVEPKQVQLDRGQFVGATGCKSSSCHGGAGEKRSQFITWTRRDIHTRGYATLTNARSERIAAALDFPQQQKSITTAAMSARCTVCHSPFQTIAPAQLAPTVDPTESVSCESCHGAAGSWLRGHTRSDWTYATRVGAGMRDLKSLYVRANTCVACQQNLDGEIAAAGHPPLVFELDSQSIAEPKHWRDPEDISVRVWLTGQAVALRELSWHLSKNAIPNEDALTQWRALAWLLGKVTTAERTLLPVNPTENFSRTQQQADALARKAAQQNLGAEFASRLTHTLAALDAEFAETADTPRELLFQRAQRLVLALERLSDFAHRAKPDAPRPAELLELREDLRWSGEFDAGRFASRLGKYRASLVGGDR
jgi:hypothetical protein